MMKNDYENSDEIFFKNSVFEKFWGNFCGRPRNVEAKEYF